MIFIFQWIVKLCKQISSLLKELVSVLRRKIAGRQYVNHADKLHIHKVRCLRGIVLLYENKSHKSHVYRECIMNSERKRSAIRHVNDSIILTDGYTHYQTSSGRG